MTKTLMTKMALGAAILCGATATSATANAKAKPSVIMPTGDIKWEPLMGDALQIAKLWGDRDKGPEYGMLLKFQPGTDSGMHAHTGDYHAIAVQGPWVHTIDGQTEPAKELTPGSYVFQPGKQMHSDLCKPGKTECIVFVHQHAKGDFIPAKKPADKAAAEKPAAEKPAADKAAAKPADKEAAKPAEKPAAKAADKAAEKPAAK